MIYRYSFIPAPQQSVPKVQNTIMSAKTKLNVHKFPRPPLLEQVSRHLTVKWGNEVVADTKQGYWALETTVSRETRRYCMNRGLYCTYIVEESADTRHLSHSTRPVSYPARTKAAPRDYQNPDANMFSASSILPATISNQVSVQALRHPQQNQHVRMEGSSYLPYANQHINK